MLRFPVSVSYKRNNNCLNEHTVLKSIVGDSSKIHNQKMTFLIDEQKRNLQSFWIEKNKQCSLVHPKGFKIITCVKRKKFKFKVFKGYPSKLIFKRETICKKYMFLDSDCKCSFMVNFIVAKLEANRYLRDYKIWENILPALVK